MKTILNDFSSIDLETTVSVASNQTRIDRKYLLTKTELTDFLNSIKDTVAVLEIDGRRVFSYESIYYDTPDLLLFKQAKQSHRHKHKIRSRLYKESGLLNLELKTKPYQYTIKNRMELSQQELTQTGLDFLAETLMAQKIPIDHLSEIKPVLITDYERATLVDTSTETRITIDQHLSFKDIESAETFNIPDYYILEIKSNESSNVYDRLLWVNKIRPHRISKYALGVSVLKGEKINKWTEVKKLMLA